MDLGTISQKRKKVMIGECFGLKPLEIIHIRAQGVLANPDTSPFSSGLHFPKQIIDIKTFFKE